nr:bile acid:sodium symporter [Mesorhizobium sp.]
MDTLITVFLPLALAVIMFSLGLGLTVADFVRVVTQPRAYALGAVSQLVVIPLVAYALALAFKLSPELAVGMMILSLSPGGVTSNLLTKLAKGDVALAVSLTGTTSLIAVVTMPLLAAFFADHFMGADAPPINITSLGFTMFLITALPVLLGLLLRRYATDVAQAIEKPLEKVAVALFVVVVLGALASNWRLFVDSLLLLGPSLVLLNIILLGFGLAAGKLFGLKGAEATAISIETGVHNATVGITVGTLIAEAASGLPPFSLPSGVYGITMYLVTIPFVLWRRRVAG